MDEWSSAVPQSRPLTVGKTEQPTAAIGFECPWTNFDLAFT